MQPDAQAAVAELPLPSPQLAIWSTIEQEPELVPVLTVKVRVPQLRSMLAKTGVGGGAVQLRRRRLISLPPPQRLEEAGNSLA
jgi:hypothetical protein